MAGVAGIGGAVAAGMYMTRKKEEEPKKGAEHDGAAAATGSPQERADAALRAAREGRAARAPVSAPVGSSRFTLASGGGGERRPERREVHDSRLYRGPGARDE